MTPLPHQFETLPTCICKMQHVHRQRDRLRGFTLVELVVSIAIMAALMLGLSSAIVISSKAVPKADSTNVANKEVAAALDQFSADLMCATSITELSTNAITFTVADRGHGSAGPETIRYAWSGTRGADLTRQYNSGVIKSVASNVSAFSLTAETGGGQLTSAPRVLMFVNSLLVSGDDVLRQSKLSAWSFPTTMLSSSATQAQFNAAVANCDVIYAPEGVSSLTLTSLFDNQSVGMVSESEGLYNAVGISSGMQYDNNYRVTIADNSHMITAGFATTSNLTISSSSIDLHTPSGTLAAGARILVTQQGGSHDPSLVVIECGDTLVSGQAARGRRVVLPWGGGQLLNPLNFSRMNNNAMTLLKRSLVWAAAPPVYRSVRVSVTAGSVPTAEVKVELVNTPRLPIP